MGTGRNTIIRSRIVAIASGAAIALSDNRKGDAGMDVEVGQVFRDTYNTGTGNVNRRTIRITSVLPNGVQAVVLTDTKGNVLEKPRTTVMKLSTLKSGYEIEKPARRAE